MTRANVLQIGLAVLLLGPISYGCLRLIGLGDSRAGILSESIIIFVVIAWTGSYLFRVVTGKMTFTEQRKRYRENYEKSCRK